MTPGRRFYRKGTDAKHTHHLHVFGLGHPQIVEHLALVEYLNDPARAQECGTLKMRLAQEHPWQIGATIAGKDALVSSLRDESPHWRHARAKGRVSLTNLPPQCYNRGRYSQRT